MLLKPLTYVSDTFEALHVLAEFVKSLIFVSNFFGTSFLLSIIYKLLIYFCIINSLLASGDA